MTDAAKPLADLTPEQRKLLALRLRMRNANQPAPAAEREGGVFPLSFAQQRMWLLDRLEPGGTAYNLAFAWRLRGPLDAAVLERAVAEIVRRHEILRTRIEPRDGEPVQVVEPFRGPTLAIIDHPIPEPDREAEYQRLATEEMARPFDLAAGPLLRASLVRGGDRDHLFLWSIHHVAGDGWSTGIFGRELKALYEAFAAGRPSPLPPLPVQYGDHAVRQRERLSGDALARETEWWKAQLAGAPALLDLPTDRPRPAVRSDRGETLAFELPPEVAGRVDALARAEGATPFMVLLAAFQVLLARWSGEDDVLVGTPIANRTTADVEGLIGYFANTLVLRGDLSGDPTFRALLARVREATLDAYDHQELPFEKLVEELNPERSLSHTPLFQVAFVLQNLAAPSPITGQPMLGEARMEPVGRERSTAKFDLTLTLSQHGAHTFGHLEYAADLWDRATVERLLGHFAVLLEAALAAPDTRISDLPLLAETERADLEARARPAASFAADTTLQARFAAQAARTPGAIAVTCDGASLTYAELDARANRVAHHLLALGAAPGDRIGLCVERSAEIVVGILAILKAGAAYLPLDPANPDDRIADMLEDSGARLVVTTAALAPRVSGDGVRAIPLDAARDAIGAYPSDAPGVFADPDSAAYVIYTSGSTGRPKGVVVTHANVLRLFAATRAWFGFGGDDVWTLFHSYAFDFSVWEIWGALLYGGRLVVVPFYVSRSPEAFHALLCRERVTVLSQTPSAFRQLAAVDDEAAAGDLALRCVIFGGEALDPASLRGWIGRRGDERPALVNMYGITETTVHVTWRPICRADADAGSASPIGIPIPDLAVQLLDGRGRMVPVGVAGEMYVAGAGVAAGYLGRPALTAERFVPDPFGRGARLYRSGDRARWLADGGLEFLGRADDQVKVRGFRIEPGEIESALLEHPGVREAVVLARDEGDQRRLVAWTVPAAGAALQPSELRAHLAARLPDYMVPAAFVALDALPLTRNGKVDRRALPEPDAAAGAAAWIAPRTPTEEVLAGIWSGLLGVDHVGGDDGFFALGGHSLLATRVVSRVREAFHVDLPLRAIFESPTLSALAAAIDRLVREGVGVVAPPLASVERTGDLPLSFVQERLWFIDRMAPGSDVYTIGGAYRLRGVLDVAALERALAEIVRRHESLRTVFVEVDGAPVARILDPRFRLRVLDAPADADGALAAFFAEPIDLARGPVFCAILVRVGAEEHRFAFHVHHIVSDGWSLGVLFAELAALYGAYARGEPSPLPPLAVQYADYAAWQRGWLRGEVLARQLAYWGDALRGAPPLIDLPTDRPRPPIESFVGAQVELLLPEGAVEAVDALARREGATPFMVLLAAYAAVLARWSAQDDVVIGTPLANRGSVQVEPLIGFFANTLALRVDLARGPGFRELLRRVREVSLGAFAHQDVPFERVVEELQPERSLAHSPVFQVMFALQNVPGGAASLPGIAMEPLGRERSIAKFDLSLTLSQAGGRLHGALEYAADLFDAITIQRFAGHFATLLGAALQSPDAPVAALPLMVAGEREELLRLSAGPDVPRDPSLTLHGLFEAQAARTPDATAVSFAGRSLTYAELDARANRLARLLRSRGATVETPVAVCMERSLEMVVALYAVLKAGACYVPIDPEYPAERVRYMLDDSAARIVLTLDVILSAAAAPDPFAQQSPAAAEGSKAAVATTPPPHADSLTVITLDAPRALDAWDDTPLAGAADPDALAYVIYTSGSTGRPKGAGNTHRGIVNRILWMQETFGLGEGDVVLQKTPFGFDVSVWELFWPLMAGARLAVAAPGAHRDPAALSRELADAGATVVHFVPSMLQAWLDDASDDGRASLRRVISSGEALSAELRDRFFAALPGVELHNLYGPTEAAVDVTWHPCSSDEDSPTVPIGRPVANTRIHVLDPRAEPCPLGVPGELFIAGAQVGRGYWRRAALTAERFVPDPFSTTPGARMYRTGDRARWTAAGELEYLGRLDFQVKIRGLRVEPGEVEAALAADPSVRAAAVAARGEGADLRLVAWVVPADPPSFSEDALRARLAAALPAYLVPDAIAALDALPLTASGKLDRRALPEPAERAAAYVAPWTPAELELADVWREVLGVELVGAGDDFFALGGHSLLAVRLASRIRQRFGRELPLAEFFRSRTLREQAAVLARDADEGPWSPLVAIHAAGESPPIFCVHPAGGTVFSYSDLALGLGPDQPFYGLQAQGVSDDVEPLATVDAMAERYLAAIRGAFPRGPYVLAGWSAGGVIAFEIARRLRAAGECVPLLVLLDTHAPGSDRPGAEPGEVDLYLGYTHDITGMPADDLAALGDELHAAASADRPRVLAEWIARIDPGFPHAAVAQIRRSVAVFGATMRAVHQHPPRPYDGDVLLVEATDAVPGYPRPEGGLAPAWRRLLHGRFEVRTVSGTHGTLLDPPQVAAVAREVSHVLDRSVSA
jgi:amino acid adenylation domain-containing protein